MGLDSGQCDMLLDAAYRQAASVGLEGCDLEDCALGFIEKMLSRAAASGQENSTAWVRLCAHNHALDYRRTRLRRQHHETVWPLVSGEDGTAVTLPNSTPTAETCVIRAEIGSEIKAAVDMLLPLPRDLFIQHHFEGVSIYDLAACSGRTAHAVEQTLLRARRRVRSILQRRGSDYVSLVPFFTGL